jgi:hypothetical protein
MEEAFYGAGIHVHAAFKGDKAVLTITSPAAIADIEGFVAALRSRLTQPNDFD